MSDFNIQEKEEIEESTINYFISGYSRELTIKEHSDKPDFILQDKKFNRLIGVEVTTLYHDNKEAQILLGRSSETTHGVICSRDLVVVLNKLLQKKATRIKGYKKSDAIFLVIRLASPIFDISTFKLHENDIKIPVNQYDEIWLILDDNAKAIRGRRWTELKQIE